MIKCNDITIRRCLGKRWGKAPEGGGWRCVPHERGWCPLSGEGWRHTCHPYACCCWCPNLHWFPMEKSIIFVRGALALPPPPEKCCRAWKLPINVFNNSLCHKNNISRWKLVELHDIQWKKMTTVEIYRKGSAPTSAHTVDFNRGLYLGSGSTWRQYFFNLLIWCLKELWHRIF